MKINIKKSIETYRVENEKNKKIYNWKFTLCMFVLMLIYSMGIDKYGEKAIYHVFMIVVCAIFIECWKNNHKNKKE